MSVVIWFIVAIALAALELLVGDFTLLMLSGGALAAAGVSLVGAPAWAAGIAFCLVSILMVATVRPIVRRQLTSRKALDTSPNALVGEHAEVLEEVTATGGQIRLDGSIWTAKALEAGESFAPHDTVTVVRIDGATAIVWKH